MIFPFSSAVYLETGYKYLRHVRACRIVEKGIGQCRLVLGKRIVRIRTGGADVRPAGRPFDWSRCHSCNRWRYEGRVIDAEADLMTRGKLQWFVGLTGEDDEQAIVREIKQDQSGLAIFHITCHCPERSEVFRFGNGAINVAKVDQLLFVELEIAILVEFQQGRWRKKRRQSARHAQAAAPRAAGRCRVQPRLGETYAGRQG